MILADHALAEDIVHDVFGTLSARAGHVLHTPDAYLRRAVRNACYDALRKQRTRRTDTVDAPFLESLEASADRPDERIAIERALRSLPPDQREVVHLKIFEGLTFQEIADATETPPNTVASRYRYALDKLRLVLGADKPEPSRGR
jgi:RNA polymerase sigma-70 factor (ECF subfamily)